MLPGGRLRARRESDSRVSDRRRSSGRYPMRPSGPRHPPEGFPLPTPAARPENGRTETAKRVPEETKMELDSGCPPLWPKQFACRNCGNRRRIVSLQAASQELPGFSEGEHGLLSWDCPNRCGSTAHMVSPKVLREFQSWTRVNYGGSAPGVLRGSRRPLRVLCSDNDPRPSVVNAGVAAGSASGPSASIQPPAPGYKPPSIVTSRARLKALQQLAGAVREDGPNARADAIRRALSALADADDRVLEDCARGTSVWIPASTADAFDAIVAAANALLDQYTGWGSRRAGVDQFRPVDSASFTEAWVRFGSVAGRALGQG